MNGKQFKLKYEGNLNRSSKRGNFEPLNIESVRIGSVAPSGTIIDGLENLEVSGKDNPLNVKHCKSFPRKLFFKSPYVSQFHLAQLL